MAAFFERAAGDADAVGGFEPRPDFFAGDSADEQAAIEGEQFDERGPAVVEQLDAESPHAAGQ